ncbi:hypothetical protein HYFRA_00005128 [Hymenoscyphus fraxineus]|uniref:ABC multidrug transporter n=1 Tax=Hymenoscyphus fraxineus TaxID=746836 RepID=A0A9N9LD94_9HELO|nr:hypothetical protein HYFRA_00005128 [Hymenoscyphus fraxineus]
MTFSGEHELFQQNLERFDFNIRFEQLFFSIIPSILFIVTSLCRTLSRLKKPTVVNAPTFRFIKLCVIAIYIILELSLLVLATTGPFQSKSMFVTASALKLTAAFFMVTLSFMDHNRSPRPSVILSSYLFLTLLLEVVQARTLFLSSDDRPQHTFATVFTTAVALKVVILLLEAQQKSKWVSWDKKEHSPEETSGIFSLGVYFWLNKMFLVGYRQIMTVEDLYPLDNSFDAKSLHDRFSANMDYSKLGGDNFGLVKVLTRTLKVSLLVPIPFRLALIGFTFCQPFFIERLLNYLADPNRDTNVGYGFIGASILIYSGIALSRAFYWYLHHRTRTMARSILVTETYIKATKASCIGTGDDSAALTLMSTDMERIRMGFRTLHEVWAGLIQVALAAWMLYIRLGVVFVAPIVLVIVCFTGLGILINFTGDSQRAWMAGVQKRVGLTASVITGTKNLKISGLATAVSDYVQLLRVKELAAGARIRKIFIIAALLGYIPLLIGPPITFAFSQRSFDVAKVFTILSFLTLLTKPLCQIFQSTPEIISGLACLGRIQAFLESGDRHDFRHVEGDRRPNLEKEAAASTLPEENLSYAFMIENGCFGWEAGKFVLQRINTRISKASLTMVVGPIGSGKSTLCKALLGEIPFHEGHMEQSSSFPHIGFCDQSAFLSNGSIRDNIVGFCPFNEERYAEVIKATALEFDLSVLPAGDETNVGSDGISLSGGQKQRVSLARALYLQADVLVLDDVFSGLDADTEKQVFRQVFAPGGLLRRRGSTVLLCTHSIRHLPSADYIITLGDGTIVEQGSYNELIASQGYVQRLRLRESANIDAPSEEADLKSESSSSRLTTTITNIGSVVPHSDLSRQVGDKTVYKHYVKSMGLIPAICSLVFAALWGFLTNFPTIWLKYWSDDISSEHSTHSYRYYAGIYALLQICGLLALLLLGITLFVVSVKRAGAKLHKEALTTLIRAPLSFYTNTDTGVITNLFSQDLNLIDTELPDATLNTLFCVFQAMGQAAVMLTSSLYLAISYPLLGILLYIVQRFYLRTSRQLRLLDLETKSPLYTHFLDTLRGISTLRAFGFLPDDVQKNAQLINSSQRPAYFLLMIQEWLNLVLDLVVMIMAVVLTTLAIQLNSNSGFAGASLFTLINFGQNLSGIVTFYTKLETSIGAIARLKAFNETVEPEDGGEEDIIPVEQWPEKGLIELKGISAQYKTNNQEDDTSNMALRNIHLTIPAGEKVAICGRSGSGKSSLIAFLLKLLEPIPSTSSNALIDNIPLHLIDRSTLRQRIIAVPQDAVFLPEGSTFQENLDPFNVSTPAECESVLTTVQLWQFVQDRGGLAAGMSPATLSAGQRQLFSLGRALLRHFIRARNLSLDGVEEGEDGGILLLDEVSSSVDLETEKVMQEVISKQFKRYTVVAVTHRLDMAMEYERVVIMDNGEIVELGNPKVLAREEGTRFGELVRAAGGKNKALSESGGGT